MNTTTILGVGAIIVATTSFIGLYVWSSRRIETIHRKKLRTLREIQKEFRS